MQSLKAEYASMFQEEQGAHVVGASKSCVIGNKLGGVWW